MVSCSAESYFSGYLPSLQVFCILLSLYAPMPCLQVFEKHLHPLAGCMAPRDSTVSSTCFPQTRKEAIRMKSSLPPCCPFFWAFSQKHVNIQYARKRFKQLYHPLTNLIQSFLDGVCPGYCEVLRKGCGDSWLLEDIIYRISSISRPVRHWCSFSPATSKTKRTKLLLMFSSRGQEGQWYPGLYQKECGW